jgi:PBP1b-binding outer membrane lipoprotein LpoB
MKIQVMLSESADLTAAQEKKIVVGGTFTLYTIVSTKKTPPRPSIGFIPKETIERYKKMPPVITKAATNYRITEVNSTKSGSVKSIVAVAERDNSLTRKHPGNLSTLTLTKAKLLSLIGNKITKEDVGSQSITLTTNSKDTTAFFNKTEAKDKQRIKALDEQIAKLQKQREELAGVQKKRNDAIHDAESAKKRAELKAQGYSYLVVIEGKETKKKTLSEARSVRPKIGETASIFAVLAGKRSKILTWSAKDPVTKRVLKGYNWFFTSAAAQKKFDV